MSNEELSGRRRVALMTHVGRPEAVAATRQLGGYLADAGFVLVMPRIDVDEMGEALVGLPVEALPPEATALTDCELMIVLGGDGSILRSAELTLASGTPLLGVNLGHVGFLAEAESSEIGAIAEAVISGDWRVEERVVIDVVVSDRDGAEVWRSFAINEVSIEKGGGERVLEVLASVDDRPLSRWACDGVLISTPTGSTAYAFSAGGPVIWPEVDALLLLPLSAHALFARPLVLGPSSTVRVDLLETPVAHQGVVWCDGRRSTPLAVGNSVRAQKSNRRLRLARLSSAPFTDRLVHKFGLQVDGFRGAGQR